jgi:hypothetical protein
VLTATDIIEPGQILDINLLELSALVIAMRAGVVTVLDCSSELARLLKVPAECVDAAVLLKRGQELGWYGDTSSNDQPDKRYAVTRHGQSLASTAVIRLLTVIAFPDQPGMPARDVLAYFREQGDGNVRH